MGTFIVYKGKFMIFKPRQENKFSESEIKKFGERNKISFKTAEILLNRNIDTDEKFYKFTNPSLDDLKDPFALSGMKECFDRIKDAIDKNQSILIFGDYDVDGISATAILYKFLKDKISTINYFLPNRYVDGYGLTIDTAKKVIDKFHPDLIITVDCGISCAKEVEYIKSQGIDIIITDHHEVPEEMPNTIVVDAKKKDEQYGFDGLCGAGVALKVVQAFVGKENLNEYLPICAIATVSDIVPLVDENRAIVKLGLSRQEYLPQGIKMLLKNLKIDEIVSSSISFKIAPKLNAAGRMGNAYPALKLYIFDDKQELAKCLKTLDFQNTKRQALSQQIYEECLSEIKQNRLFEQSAIILKSKNWDSGLLGIACARLVDDFYRPVFLFSDVDGELKGSVRSVDSINIHTVLSCCSSFLDTFGGHSMAAGLSLKTENFEIFKSQILEYLQKNATKTDYLPVKMYDIKINSNQLNLQFAKELQLLEPFGCENPNPMFLVEYKDCLVSKLAGHDNHLNLTIDKTLKCIAFNSGEYFDDYLYSNKKQSILEIQINKFGKNTTVKGIIKNTLFFGYGEKLQNIASGRQLKQIYAQNPYTNSIKFFEIDRLFELLTELLKNENGVAVVVSNQKTYFELKSIFDRFELNYFVGGSQSKSAENCLVFALDGIESLANYRHIIFCDGLFEKNFLNGYEGKIYCASNQNFRVENLNFDRAMFGNVYITIKDLITTKQEFHNELELYEKIKKSNKVLSKLSYSQFVLCFYTFLQLEIIRIVDNKEFLLQIDENKKTNLENSKFYNQLHFLSKIKWENYAKFYWRN